MYCQKCGNRIVKETVYVHDLPKQVKTDHDQEVYAAAHRMYRDWQKSRKQMEEAKLRDIAREVYKEILLVEYEKRKSFPATCRSGVPWVDSEDRVLRKEFDSFVYKTANDHRRSYNAIAARLQKLIFVKE